MFSDDQTHSPALNAGTAFSMEDFNRQFLLDLIDQNQELYDQLLNLFKDKMPESLLIMRKAVDQGDHTSLAFQAHAVKGRCANIGATRMKEIARAIEMMAREKQPMNESVALLMLLESAWQQFASKY